MAKKTKKRTTHNTRKEPIVFTPFGVGGLVELLDNHYSDNGKGERASEYRRTFQEELHDRLLTDEVEHLYGVVSQLEQFYAVEEAIRRAGFIQGFYAAKQLLAGDRELTDVIKGGAR